MIGNCFAVSVTGRILGLLCVFYVNWALSKYTERTVDCTSLAPSCIGCTQNEGCGWCQASQKCMNSTNGEPDGNCDIWWLTCTGKSLVKESKSAKTQILV
jgi:hypothetical protein